MFAYLGFKKGLELWSAPPPVLEARKKEQVRMFLKLISFQTKKEQVIGPTEGK